MRLPALLVILFTLALFAMTNHSVLAQETPVKQGEKKEPDTVASLPGFHGVKWGDSVEIAKAILSKDFVLTSANLPDDTLIFDKGVLGGRDIEGLYVYFGDHGFAKADVFFKSKNRNKIFSLYDETKALLVEKYGTLEPKNDFAFFQAPFRKGDGLEIASVMSNKAHFAAFWPFKDGNAILIRITDRYEVMLTYENQSMNKARLEQIKKRDANDL